MPVVVAALRKVLLGKECSLGVSFPFPFPSTLKRLPRERALEHLLNWLALMLLALVGLRAALETRMGVCAAEPLAAVGNGCDRRFGAERAHLQPHEGKCVHGNCWESGHKEAGTRGFIVLHQSTTEEFHESKRHDT